MSLTNLEVLVREVSKQAQMIEFADVQLPQSFIRKFQDHVESEAPEGYKSVEWAQHTAKITTSTGKVIFLPNIAIRMAAVLAPLAESLALHKKVFVSIFGNDGEIANNLKDGKFLSYEEQIDQYFEKNDLSAEDKTNFMQFVSDYDSWGGGKAIDRGDFLVSGLLKAGNMLAVTSGAVAQLAIIFSSQPALLDTFKELPAASAVDSSPLLKFKDTELTLPKPFVLLAGISGTGKTRFVIEQATRSSNGEENLCIVAVRPDWHEPSDLLGYVSRISGKPEYVATDMLRFIVKAWQRIAPGANSAGMGDLDFSAPPYWLCLDEMNLAPVEQYFADYLSALETRKLSTQGYTCESLVSENLISADDFAMRDELGLKNHPELWDYFAASGISIPPNLIVAGTVNMDETTHSFSRKVIDRAMTLDFGEFFPNNVDDFFSPTQQSVIWTYPQIAQATLVNSVFSTNDSRERTAAFFTSLNSVLEKTPFELGFRALNELLLTVICFRPSDNVELQAVWDDFLMMKVLPRIEGDEDKLTRMGEGENSDVLKALEFILQSAMPDIWDGQRPDYFRISNDSTNPIQIQCRSKDKIDWMRKRLALSSYTSFWP